MKISRSWLQTWFEKELPPVEELSTALTFHAFEIDGVEDDVLDVKVTPNRGHDCLSYRGIAKEISAILQIPLKARPEFDLAKKTDAISITLSTPQCHRFVAGYIKNVNVAPSPAWLKDALEKQGQRSINNVVDVTNYVMFNIGQPLHAFDAGQLKESNGTYAFEVRTARDGEMMLALDDKEYKLSSTNMVVSDKNADVAVGIAGVKGGKPAAITESTKDIIIECANFDGPSVRKTSRALNLRTDASQRFEQVISPEMTLWSMADAIALILELAGGEFVGIADNYPELQQKTSVSVTLEHINKVLGVTLSVAQVSDVFSRLLFSVTEKNRKWTVHIPPERIDLTIPEDLIEEVGRIIGYETITPVELPDLNRTVILNDRYARNEQIRAFLIGQGFTEVFTSVFADKGERVVLNKVDGVRPYLRDTLKEGLKEALERNIRNKELLGLSQVKLFEIGTVWRKEQEEMTYDIAVEKVKKQKTEDEYRVELEQFVKSLPKHADAYPEQQFTTTEHFQHFSKYPYVVRDISLWVSPQSDAESVIRNAPDNSLVQYFARLDRFEKEGRVSELYRFVFQSFEKTLTDEEVNAEMQKVYDAVKARGWEVR